eukprot:CAMPEP_0198288212 /NCGR_PEP_ID=MMETSP1449-20131203/6800_1 /TAXON_ID=420275 /ORGANISM="Attheya septentrionalis, Strain CCMP2084" /LENGTH=212 /DNA_ID=CAMNT_0043986325 /DNA_START=179 /DNA_END=817 /DNA_ORIENTATION=-
MVAQGCGQLLFLGGCLQQDDPAVDEIRNMTRKTFGRSRGDRSLVVSRNIGQITGCLKRLRSPGRRKHVTFSQTVHWVHVPTKNFTPDLWYSSEDIKTFDQLDDDRRDVVHRLLEEKQQFEDDYCYCDSEGKKHFPRVVDIECNDGTELMVERAIREDCTTDEEEEEEEEEEDVDEEDEQKEIEDREDHEERTETEELCVEKSHDEHRIFIQQ